MITQQSGLLETDCARLQRQFKNYPKKFYGIRNCVFHERRLGCTWAIEHVPNMGKKTLDFILTVRGSLAWEQVGGWEPRHTTESHNTTSLMQVSYWEKTQNSSCLWLGAETAEGWGKSGLLWGLWSMCSELGEKVQHCGSIVWLLWNIVWPLTLSLRSVGRIFTSQSSQCRARGGFSSLW